MLNTLFSTVLDTSSGAISISGFLICIITSLALGLVIGLVHMRSEKSSRGFTITLAMIPAIVAVVIMMVNGNIGAGVAVAGTFSLIRFRSAPGTAKEIGAIFLSMAVGLACGMGYPGFAAIFALILCLVMVIYNKSGFGSRGGMKLDKTLKITVPEDLNYTEMFDDLFDKYTSKHELLQIKTTNLGSLNRLTYALTLKDAAEEKSFIDELRCRNGNLEIAMSVQANMNNEL